MSDYRTRDARDEQLHRKDEPVRRIGAHSHRNLTFFESVAKKGHERDGGTATDEKKRVQRAMACFSEHLSELEMILSFFFSSLHLATSGHHGR